MYKHETLRRLTPSAVTIAIGGALLSGCGRPQAESNETCYPGVVTHSVSQSVHEVLSKNGHKLNDMLLMNEASAAINSTLVELHQHANNKYDTVLPDDTFEVCVDGNNVAAGHKFSVIDN